MRKKVSLSLFTAVTVPTSVGMLAKLAICCLILLLATSVAAQSETPSNPCEAVRTIPAVSMHMGAATSEATAEASTMGNESESMGPMVPSNPGGPGPALDLTGDPQAGAQILADNCKKCHGENGQGGVANPGSDEGVIPSLNPLDEDMFDNDPKVYECILDLYVEHGSVPAGDNPQQTMPAWGDEGKLTPQQIADVLTYVMSLNPLPTEGPTAEATPAVTPESTEEIARPSNEGGPGPALDLVGDPQAGAQLFVDNCQKCHGENGQGGVANPGSDDGTVPPLNPIDETLINGDMHTYAYNLDLFLEHGSIPEGDNPQQTMPAWGDEGKLTPQQIADLISYVMSLNPAPEATAEATPEAMPAATPESTEEVARPSNEGGAGPALDLTGDPQSGAQLFAENCQKCHGENGEGGVDNPGSDDGTVPPLNPIDETLISSDAHTYAYNLDLFLEHGSIPEGDNPQQTMPAWGDEGKLTPQQIADLIAYVMGLNPAPSATTAP